ncbi:M10 family metallopeptidase C-terminal domain-containing protein [Pseudomonas sp. Z3-8]|uniref:M10 family metallopeptidase C-terminal domain-containing protein n=1 Tax=Pseudomonas sp. Z3-8 TaxID=2817412 RepID=UPI003DA7AAB8
MELGHRRRYMVDPDGAVWLGAYSRLGLVGEEDSGFTGSLVWFNANGSLDLGFGNPDDGYQHLDGGREDDFLLGTASFDDAISGEAGDDLLDGQQGRDLLTGGGNNDVFRFDALSDSYRTATENHTDRLIDYTAGEDTIDLSALGFTRLGNGYKSLRLP